MDLPSVSHWTRVYEETAPGALSLHPRAPAMSLKLIKLAAARLDEPAMDIDAGALLLTEHLLDRGCRPRGPRHLASPT